MRGLYREEMIGAIEAGGRRWRIAFSSSSLASIQDAVADGMGISLLPRRAITRQHRVLDRRHGLPPVDSYEVYCSTGPARTRWCSPWRPSWGG